MSEQVLPDGMEDGERTWGIVCDQEIPGGSYSGHVRPAGRLHEGKFVYPFSSRYAAEGALAEMLTDKEATL